MLCGMPYKLINTVTFNVPLYFMTNLRRTPEAFFTFLLFSFVIILTMSMIFRTIAATSRTLSQALVPAAILILGLVIYTGFTIPPNDMRGWSRWMNYVNPIAYGFESLMVNEFHGRNFRCLPSSFIPSGPGYEHVTLNNKICSSKGAQAGLNYVSGDAYLRTSFQYYNSHKWRNLGIIFGFMIFFMTTHLLATEYISESKSKGEVLIFRRGHTPPKRSEDDVELVERVGQADKTEDSSGKEVTASIQKQTAVFQWQDVCYDIKIKKEERRILDHVDGWVKPGTCTALMVSFFIRNINRFV